MATYRRIQEWVQDQYRWKPETCWIAHCKDWLVSTVAMLKIAVGANGASHVRKRGAMLSSKRSGTSGC